MRKVSVPYQVLIVIAVLATGLALGTITSGPSIKMLTFTETSIVERTSTIEKLLTQTITSKLTKTLDTTVSLTTTIEARTQFPPEREVLELAKRLRPEIVEVLTDRGGGTGFIVHAKGYVLTNRHVVEGATSFEVVSIDGKKYKATLVAKADTRGPDIALLRIDSETEFTFLKFGDTKELKRGDTLFAIGHPGIFGKWVVIAGEFAKITRVLPDPANPDKVYEEIEVKAPGGEGESGAPFFNMQGKIVGIVFGDTPDTEEKLLGPESSVVVWFGNLGKYWRGVFSAGLTTGTIYDFLEESVGEQLAKEIFGK